MSEIERLRERVAKLEAALAFYADADRWREFSADERAAAFDRNYGSEFSDDQGALARKVLADG